MDGFCWLDAGKGFVDYCEDLYGTLVGVLSRFRRYWLRDFDTLPAAEKASAHLREQQVLGHVLRGLVEVYETDTMIRADLPSGFESESVSRFTLENIPSALRSGEESCPVLFGGLRRDCGRLFGPSCGPSQWSGQGFLDNYLSIFRRHLALSRKAPYIRSWNAVAARCGRARCT